MTLYLNYQKKSRSTLRQFSQHYDKAKGRRYTMGNTTEDVAHQGKVVARYRDAKGWSQADLAEALGIDLRTVQRMEKQPVIKNPQRRALLVGLLGIPLMLVGLDTQLEELQAAATAGRIQQKDTTNAAKLWDVGLGAHYMAEQAMQKGVPSEAIWVEDESLHTRENAEYVLATLQKHGMQRIILVTSPFHQLRTYLTFAKIFQLHGIEIINYYADTGEWHPATWFLSAENRKLVQSEMERIQIYREKGDLL
jgi:ribosome-binding protein aMBF1 (putative translation factor)